MWERGDQEQGLEVRAVVRETRELAKGLWQRRGTESVPAELEEVQRVEQSGAQDLAARQR